MIEVESKIKIKNPDFWRKRISQIARYVGKERKTDFYYTLEHDTKYPKKSLRVRRKKGHYEVNFKNKISYINGVYAKKEVEFKVKDIKDFLATVEEFGFKKWLKKEKFTELYKIKDNFHIELNRVNDLGWYIEIEYLARPDEVKYARNEVLRVMKSLGITPRSIIKKGYTKILWDKKH